MLSKIDIFPAKVKTSIDWVTILAVTDQLPIVVPLLCSVTFAIVRQPSAHEPVSENTTFEGA
jgi:hypothetical protein